MDKFNLFFRFSVGPMPYAVLSISCLSGMSYYHSVLFGRSNPGIYLCLKARFSASKKKIPPIPKILTLIVAMMISPSTGTFAGPNEARQEIPALIYRVGGGMDHYQDGDHYGYVFTMCADGSYRLEQQIWQSRNDEGTLDPVLVSRGNLTASQIRRLLEEIDANGFFSFPMRLPTGSPFEIGYYEPAETVILTVHRLWFDEAIQVFTSPGPDPSTSVIPDSVKRITAITDTASIHSVEAYLGAERRHFPEGFRQLNRFFRDVVRELVREASER